MKWLSLILLAASCCAQSYTARTDVTAQSYPGTIPKAGSGCTDGTTGCFVGQNYYFTPSDFATPILRVTDVNTPTANSAKSFVTDCGGSAETNIMDSSDSVFYFCDIGTSLRIMTFNSAVPSVSLRYSGYTVPGCGSGSTNNLFFSFTQSQLAYASCFNASGNPVVSSFNFTSTSTGPTVGNGGVNTVFDASTCFAALAGVGSTVTIDDVSVSDDDQTFAFAGSTTTGQGSSGEIYVVVWNRTLGCRGWNTNTNVVSGSYGSSPTGAVSFTGNGVTAPFTGSFTLHNVRLGNGGTWVKVSCESCSVANFYWQLNTVNVYEEFNDATFGCGHTAIGVNLSVNGCAGDGHYQAMFSRPNNSQGAYTLMPTTFPSAVSPPWGTHFSWNNNNSGDTQPTFATTEISGFTPNEAWDNEIIGVYPSGAVYRFAHHYGTNQSPLFAPANEIGDVSADGKYYIWTTDWDGLLGNQDGVTSSCTITTNCRADVFLAILPLAAPGSSSIVLGGDVVFGGNFVMN